MTELLVCAGLALLVLLALALALLAGDRHVGYVTAAAESLETELRPELRAAGLPWGDAAARDVRLRVTAGHDNAVVIGGVDIARHVRGLTLKAGVGQIPTLALELLVTHGGEIHGEGVRCEVDEATRSILVALGWTPPGGDRG